MDDNAPVHRAHTVENYEDQNEVTSTEWPAQSPDLYIKVILKLDFPQTVLKLARGKCKQTPPY